MSNATIDKLSKNTFTRQKADGTTVEWHQEDESAVQSKAEAVAMVQRTIDFWLPMLVRDLQVQNNLSLSDAIAQAQLSFSTNLVHTLAGAPFAKRWEMTVADFRIHMEDK